VRPYHEKKGDSSRKVAGLLQRRIYLMNLPYDTSNKELEALIKPFAQVEDVAIARDK
jgi:RNA recognition motif-containing protein